MSVSARRRAGVLATRWTSARAECMIDVPLDERELMGKWIAIGIALGAGVGASVDNIGLGMAIGVAVGAAIGGVQQGPK